MVVKWNPHFLFILFYFILFFIYLFYFIFFWLAVIWYDSQNLEISLR